MSTCQQLATKDDLKALEQKLKAAIEAKLDKSEKPTIISQGATKGKELALSAVGVLLAGYVTLGKHN